MDDALPRPPCAQAENSGRPDAMQVAPSVMVCPGKTSHGCCQPMTSWFSMYGSVEDVFIVRGSTQVFRLRRVVRREMPALGCDRLGDVTWELQAEARNGAIESSIVGI